MYSLHYPELLQELHDIAPFNTSPVIQACVIHEGHYAYVFVDRSANSHVIARAHKYLGDALNKEHMKLEDMS